MSAFSYHGARRAGFLLSGIALLAGGCIYLFLRPGCFRLHSWLDALGFPVDFLTGIKCNGRLTVKLPDWFLYSLPDGLWTFAYTLMIVTIWAGSPSRMRYFWYVSIPSLVFGFELIQACPGFPGTFSTLDLLFTTVGLLAGLLILIILKSKHRLKESCYEKNQ